MGSTASSTGLFLQELPDGSRADSEHLAVMQAEHNILGIITEQPAEQVDPADVRGIRLHADLHRDQRLLAQVEVVE